MKTCCGLFDIFDVLSGLVETLYGTSPGSALSGLASVVIFGALVVTSTIALQLRIRASELVS